MASSSPSRKSTHAFPLAVFSSAWTSFSLLAVFDWFDSRRTIHDPNAIPCLVIWSINLLLVGLTVYLYRREKKREALCLSGEVLEAVDLTLERKRLASEFLDNIKQLPGIMLWFIAFSMVFLLMGYSFNSKIPYVEPLVAMGVLLFVTTLVIHVSQALESYAVAVRRNRAYEEQCKTQQSAHLVELPLQSPGIE